MTEPIGGLVRPDVSAADAIQIARDCYGIEVTATELGSNQDRNYLLTEASGLRSVLRIDNPVFSDEVRDGQHAALEAYHRHGVPAAAVIPGLNGELTQNSHGFAVRRSEFAVGEPLVSAGYLAPSVLESFGVLAGASVRALANLIHPGLERVHMWDMRVAAEETRRLLPAITDESLRELVRDAVNEADAALQSLRQHLPIQVIHGDLTDDNVMGLSRTDGRVYPHTVLDLGDLAVGWRVAELAVTVSSLLHHDAAHPLRVLDAVAAYHRIQPLTSAESRALWPLVVLRASLLVASGWRQLEIDGENEYARERIEGEQLIFYAATAIPLPLVTESVLACVEGADERAAHTPASPWGVDTDDDRHGISALLPSVTGTVTVADTGIESGFFAGGAWLSPAAETEQIAAELRRGAELVVLPYGVYRLTRTTIDAAEAAPTWPLSTELALAAGTGAGVVSPVAGSVELVGDREVRIRFSDDWVLCVRGIAPDRGLVVGAPVGAGKVLGQACEQREFDGTAWQTVGVTVVRRDVASLLATADGWVLPALVPAWQRLTRDPASLLGLPELAQTDTAAVELARRERIFASAQERYYERPMQIERGWQHHLIDTTGRAYIDMVNNVTGLGHGHLGVADAVNRQIRLLNTNSRFLYRSLAEYSERLLALMPAGSGLDTVLLVNSGSEAVDLALRLAQAATGRQTIVALREAYHGWTMASDAVTTSAYDNPEALHSRPSWVHVADVPNAYRGTYRGVAAGSRYVTDLRADIAGLDGRGAPVAGFICESVLGNAGGVQLPDGYLREAYDAVRSAGGLCIADEVQVGFGRMGSTFWGFEQSGVTPDIVTIAKPMGNGFPIGGVITSKRIADALASQGQFFSSGGGNPLSCQAGIAVLDAMETEGLQENARVVGAHLAAGFRALAETHRLIGPVHGEGLYLGVELVRDHETLEPASAEAAAICERLRELGVVVLTTSERSNVLKVKPPLTLTIDSANAVLRALDEVLTTGW